MVEFYIQMLPLEILVAVLAILVLAIKRK